MAIDGLRAKGVKAGLIKLRLWRPFPFAEIKAVVKNAKKLIVTDRAVSFGGPGGPVFSEIKSACMPKSSAPRFTIILSDWADVTLPYLILFICSKKLLRIRPIRQWTPMNFGE